MAGLAATVSQVSQRAPGRGNTSAIVASVPPPCSTLSVLSSQTPALLLGPADASVAKKRASTRPYNEFCQELRPLLPARLRNAEREKLLGAAWKALSDKERHQFTAAGTPMPVPSSGRKRAKGRHGPGSKVLHAPAHASELQLLLAAPLAPQLQLAVLSRAPELQSAPTPNQERSAHGLLERTSSGQEQAAAAQGMGEYGQHHTHPHPSQRQPARPPPAPPLSQAPAQAPPQRPPQQRAALPPRPPPRPPHAPPQYQPQQYMSVPPGMGVPSGAQHWGSAGPGAYMVPANSMGMMPAPPMLAMYPGVNGYMMVSGAYMMAGMGSGMPPAWAQQWQQFQQ